MWVTASWGEKQVAAAARARGRLPERPGGWEHRACSPPLRPSPREPRTSLTGPKGVVPQRDRRSGTHCSLPLGSSAEGSGTASLYCPLGDGFPKNSTLCREKGLAGMSLITCDFRFYPWAHVQAGRKRQRRAQAAVPVGVAR